MSTVDPYLFVKTLLTADSAGPHRPPPRGPAPRVVTLSRDFGAKGGTIGHRLADTLGIRLYDREILERIATKTRIDAFKLQGHDEDVAAGISTFLYSLLTGTAGELETYRRALHEVVTELARQDCLLIGRGAHLILQHQPVFRVRIVGTRPVCARRVADEFGLSPAAAEQRVVEINRKRENSVQALYKDLYENCSLEHASNFDLVVNTDRIEVDAAVPLILLGMQQAGFELQPTAPTAR